VSCRNEGVAVLGDAQDSAKDMARSKKPTAETAAYVTVKITNGTANGPSEAHLYDLGPARGFKLVGLMPDEADQSVSTNATMSAI
jgi:hypothetical protein